jgi:hypothetical protein
MNLPPQERFKRQNILVVGFVPGPNNPKNLDSFMYPLVEEFRELGDGIEAWNGYQDKAFTLRAYITVVTGDMPGRSKLQGFKGSRAVRYCPYCYVRAVHSGRSTYCPFHMPKDSPANSAALGREDYDILALRLRGDDDTRKAAKNIVALGSDELGKQYGINNLAILAGLPSIDLVKSFPPDSMHLFWENILPDLVKHWRGRFDTLDPLEATSTGTKRSAPGDVSSVEPPRKKRATANSSGAITDHQTTRRSDKFQTTEDPWNVSPAEWDAIGHDMVKSYPTFPLHFGEAVRDFWEHCHHMKAAEWKNFCLVLLPVYLKDRLPDVDYKALIDFLAAIRICLQPSIRAAEIEMVRQKMKDFLEYYEHRYYALRFNRLPACLPVFHQLAHVADFLDTLGPMWMYSQWVMERVCGLMVRNADNRFTANRNMEINLLLQEQRNLIPFLNLELEDNGSNVDGTQPDYRTEIWLDELGNQVEPPSGVSSTGEDADGNINLLEVMLKLLHPSKSANSNPMESDDQPILRPPHYTMSFEGTLTRALRHCLGPNIERPSSYVQWSACLFPASKLEHTTIVPRPFTVRSSTRKKSNSTRLSSCVRVAADSSNLHFYGEVRFFFSVTIADENHHLAYIQRWKTLSDGGLVYKAAQGHVLCVVRCCQIEELVGLVNRDDRLYIVRELGMPTTI